MQLTLKFNYISHYFIKKEIYIKQNYDRTNYSWMTSLLQSTWEQDRIAFVYVWQKHIIRHIEKITTRTKKYVVEASRLSKDIDTWTRELLFVTEVKHS